MRVLLWPAKPDFIGLMRRSSGWLIVLPIMDRGMAWLPEPPAASDAVDHSSAAARCSSVERWSKPAWTRSTWRWRFLPPRLALPVLTSARMASGDLLRMPIRLEVLEKVRHIAIKDVDPEFALWQYLHKTSRLRRKPAVSKPLRSIKVENLRTIWRRPFIVRFTFAFGGVATAREFTFKILQSSQDCNGIAGKRLVVRVDEAQKRARLARAFARSSVREAARAPAILHITSFNDIPFCGSPHSTRRLSSERVQEKLLSCEAEQALAASDAAMGAGTVKARFKRS